jgi:hypothetical protein
MVGARAATHAHRYLVDVATGANGTRLMRCWSCGAYWELHEDELSEEGQRRIRLRRVRTPATIEDWRMYEGEDRD